MDERFAVDNPPRPGVSDALAGVPMVTVAWRVLRSQHKRLAEAQRHSAAEAEALKGALAAVAEEAYRLRREAAAQAPAGGDGGPEVEPAQPPRLLRIAERLEEALARAGVTILAPHGEAYTPELMEFLENTAQVPSDEIDEPQVAEVIAPAVLHQGELLRMGKVVVAIPAALCEPAGPEAPADAPQEPPDADAPDENVAESD
jgi:hypothetical protein